MRLCWVLFVLAMGLMGGCSDTPAAPTGFGNANNAPHEHSLEKQAPLQLPTSFERLPPPQ